MNSKCAVCTDCDLSDDNLLLKCKICRIEVHMLCYGYENYEKYREIAKSNEWKCSPCNIGVSESICELCCLKGGALKKTTCRKWVHVICSLFIVGVNFTNQYKMEPVNITGIPESHRNKTCVLCDENYGSCCSCHEKGCKNFMHVTCAQKAGCLREEKNKNDSIDFRAYCTNHKKSKPSRLSSIFVQTQLDRSISGAYDESDDTNPISSSVVLDAIDNSNSLDDSDVDDQSSGTDNTENLDSSKKYDTESAAMTKNVDSFASIDDRQSTESKRTF